MTITTTFEAKVRREDRASILDLAGEINSLADDALSAAYEQAQEGTPERIILDFEHVDYINSTGIALIVGLLARARVAQLPLEARGLTEHYREIFKITRLSDFIQIQ
jgi:anti-anti-sigma factor